jgi:hypothetical protein
VLSRRLRNGPRVPSPARSPRMQNGSRCCLLPSAAVIIGGLRFCWLCVVVVAVNTHRASGRLFVASAPGGSAGSTGSITVVDLKDGAILQTIDGFFPQDMTIDEGLNRAYATVSMPPGPSHVAVIDATSGRLIRTVTAGRYPGQVIASAHRPCLCRQRPGWDGQHARRLERPCPQDDRGQQHDCDRPVACIGCEQSATRESTHGDSGAVVTACAGTPRAAGHRGWRPGALGGGMRAYEHD